MLYTSIVSKRQNHRLAKRLAIDIGGFGLILLGLLTGWLPGPGGIPLVLAGLGLLSLNYEWAEKILKNFDKKRIEYTERYLNADPLTARIIDVMSLIMLTASIWLIFFQGMLALKGLGIGLSIVSIYMLGANQHRFQKFRKFLNKNKR